MLSTCREGSVFKQQILSSWQLGSEGLGKLLSAAVGEVRGLRVRGDGSGRESRRHVSFAPSSLHLNIFINPLVGTFSRFGCWTLAV